MGFFSRWFGPPTPAQFAQRVMEIMKKAGIPREGVYDPDKFQIVYQEADKSVGYTNLRNLYAEFCRLKKKDRDSWLRKTCIALMSSVEMPEEFADVQPDLRPAIRSRAYAEFARLGFALAESEAEPATIAGTPISDFLMVALVYDLPNSIRFVTEDIFQKWDVTLYEALEVAKQNLEELPVAVASIGDKVFMYMTNDSYDATRMLRTDLLRKLPLQGRPIAVPVHRDCLIIASEDDEESWPILCDLIEKMRGEPRPISTIPHILDDDAWSAWLPPRSHPLYHRVLGFRQMQLSEEYHEQKELLDKIQAGDDEAPFVATYMLAEDKQQRLESFCVWTRGVVSLLPTPEIVCLLDPEQDSKLFVPWEIAQATLADLLTETDHYPTRWLVTDFPSVDQLEELARAASREKG